MYELIRGNPLEVKEYRVQRIDKVHQRADDTARRNFNTNREHFIENVDFFLVCEYEISM